MLHYLVKFENSKYLSFKKYLVVFHHFWWMLIICNTNFSKCALIYNLKTNLQYLCIIYILFKPYRHSLFRPTCRKQFAIRSVRSVDLFRTLLMLSAFCTLCIMQKFSKSFLWYFVVCIFWILLSFVNFHIKRSSFYGTSYSLVIILNVQISQGSVAT